MHIVRKYTHEGTLQTAGTHWGVINCTGWVNATANSAGNWDNVIGKLSLSPGGAMQKNPQPDCLPLGGAHSGTSADATILIPLGTWLNNSAT